MLCTALYRMLLMFGPRVVREKRCRELESKGLAREERMLASGAKGGYWEGDVCGLTGP